MVDAASKVTGGSELLVGLLCSFHLISALSLVLPM